MNEGIMTTGEVAKLLRISRQSVNKMSQDGRLPSIRIGKLLRFKKEDVDKYLEAGGDTNYGIQLRQYS